MFIGLYRLMRMLLGTIRDRESARQIAFGVAFGMLIGLCPKDSLFVVAFGIFLLATTSNVFAGTISAFAFAWLSVLVDPLSHRVGKFLLMEERLTPYWVQLMEYPLVAWTRFNNTIVAGSVAIGILLFYPVYQISLYLIEGLLPKIHEKLGQNRLYRWFVGPDTEEVTPRKARAIKWSYVVPRLLLIVVLGVSVWLFKDPAIKYAIVKSGETATGAKVDIESVRSDVAHTSFSIRRLQAANPSKTNQNIFEADSALLQFDRDALLRKRFVIKSGRINGLAFNTQRTADGSLQVDPSESSASKKLAKSASEIGKQWLEHAENSLKQSARENLQTVRVSEELIQRWPNEYKALEVRSKQLKARIQSIVDVSKAGIKNPLRDFAKYQNAVTDVTKIQQDINFIRAELKRLESQIKIDQNRLIQAKEHDQKMAVQLVKSSKVNAKSVTKMLLGDQQTQRLEEVLVWVKWLRDTIPDPERDFQPTREIGEDIVFPGIKSYPAFLAEVLAINGRGTVAGQSFDFKGNIKGLTSDPKVYGKPTEFFANAQGRNDVLVRIISDRTKDYDQETVSIRCPSLNFPSQVLGDPDSLLVSLSPSNMDLNVKMRILKGNDGKEYLTGRVVAKQTDVRMMLGAVPPALKKAQMATTINEQLSSVDNFQVTATLSGTVKDPKWKIQSDLGGKLANSMNTALQTTIDTQVLKLRRDIDKIAGEKLSEINNFVFAKQSELTRVIEKEGIRVAELENLFDNVLKLNRWRR